MVIIVGVCVLVVGAAVWFARRHAPPAPPRKGRAPARWRLPPVPVIAAAVAQKDVPIYLSGIGTVQAFNTVTVRARVDGQVDKIAFTEGQDVHAGDLLAQIDPNPFRAALAQAVAKKGQDEAQLANARVDLKRYADLLANEGVTQQQYDTQKALVDQLVATVNADQAAIESAKVQLDYTTIVSPIDGRIGLRLVDQGNIVHANDANGLRGHHATQAHLRRLHSPGTDVCPRSRSSARGPIPICPVVAVSQGDTTVLGEGKLAVIDNQIDPTTRQFKLKATFPNTDLRLWPGQFVNARLLLTVRKGCAVVPAAVIQRGPEGPFVFVIKDDQTVEVRPVKVCPDAARPGSSKAEVMIEEGLRPGERVVVEGQYQAARGVAHQDSRRVQHP